MNQMVIGGWYSAIYKSGFNITFQVLALEGKSISLCREDGAITDNLPSGFVSLVSHGDRQPLVKSRIESCENLHQGL